MDITFILFITIVLAAFGFAIYSIVKKSKENFIGSDCEEKYWKCVQMGGGSDCHKYIK